MAWTLEKVRRRGGARPSALWELRELPGVLLGNPAGRGWMVASWLPLTGPQRAAVRRLHGQHFPTRRAALQALEAVLQLDAGEAA